MGRFLQRSLFFFVLASATAITGCKQHSTERFTRNTQEYSLKGTIVAVDASQGEVTIQHDAIPGLMEAMTMPYKLAHAEVASELHPGDVIRARLLVQRGPDGEVSQARLDQIAVLAQARPNFKPTSNYHVPTPGDAVPDFHFVDQDSKPVVLSHLHGKAVLITFIYTRCPMNDFCPKMSRNFAAIDKALHADKALYDRTHLLSISFDPVYDTPAVLRSYGKAYTGDSGFAHWQFVAPTKHSLDDVEHYFNLGATPGENSTITHSLSTVLIDPAGKIAAWYPGGDWNPDEVVAKMRVVAGT